MDNYVDFDFYKDVYGGTLITDVDTFKPLLNKAERIYDNYTRKHEMTKRFLRENKKPAQAIRLCLCEMIDNVFKFNELIDIARGNDSISAEGVSSETVKSHSVSFEKSDTLKSTQLSNQMELVNRTIMNEYLSVYGLLYRGL